MSDGTIRHDGDSIATKVPLLVAFQGDMVALAQFLDQTLGQYKFVDNPKDELSKLAQMTFEQIMAAFGQIYGALGEAVGLQGDRLNTVRGIGEGTEAGAAGHASGWAPPGGGHRG
ncbi:hypothetical protein CC117_27375 [Parafrankia colletiae]|uniref:Uncharacterized protein n=1 Tax=Parafrankia colletiae TaxID=573497 RepID=A0A1S1QBK1_9ACTN|nr:hypothetical protein [Parafrankia colletiae]MCK9903745.1 hypothetical protein [Frankia sp. Cpl3]OHV30841.1 hypothetical protein CC117_27375 [Parafrankia colletiae]